MTEPSMPGLDPEQFTLSLEECFAGVLGIEVDTFEPRGAVTAHVPVTTRLMQPMGIIHGGVYASIGESVASIATVANVISDGMVAVGMSNNTSFLRPISSGTMLVQAVPLHMGRTTWIWQVEISDDGGKRCAISMVTLAVRPGSDFQPPASS